MIMKDNYQNPHAIGIDNCRKRLELESLFLYCLQKKKTDTSKPILTFKFTMKKLTCIAIHDEPIALLIISQFCGTKRRTGTYYFQRTADRAEGNSRVQT